MGILSFFRRKRAKEAPAEVAGAAGAVASAASVPELSVNAPAASEVEAAILGPVVTEKNSALSILDQYGFRVAPWATKQIVRRAIERQFRVHVTRVNVLNVRSKIRRRGRIEGQVPGYRKALVTLKEGERIDLLQDLR